MTRFDFFVWLVTILSLFGTVLNIRRSRMCFFIWTFTNLAWLLVDLSKGICGRAALDAVYVALAIWGILEWRKSRQS